MSGAAGENISISVFGQVPEWLADHAAKCRDVIICRQDKLADESFKSLTALCGKFILSDGDLTSDSRMRLFASGARDVWSARDKNVAEIVAASLNRFRQRRNLCATLSEVSGFVGNSPATRLLREQIAEASLLADVPVLLLGDTGTGKMHAAKAMHAIDPLRAPAPLATLDCGAATDEIFASDFFGHLRGAFTGADRSREGAIVTAAQGYLVLDEIGELSPRLQSALLGVLQEMQFKPVGSDRSYPVRCRMIALTNRPLPEMVEAGTLNEVVLESLVHDDLNAFETDDGYDYSNAGQYEWSDQEAWDGGGGNYEADDLFGDSEYDLSDQYEAGNDYADPSWGQGGYGSNGLTDSEVHELASSLMALETPAEAEEFLGRVLKKAKGKLAKVARPLVAKVAPLVGAGLGSIVPGVGTALGGMAGKALGSLIGGNRSGGRGGGPNVGGALAQFIGKGGNPLAGVLQSNVGKGILGKLMGGEMEMASDAEAQFELAKRAVRALDEFAQEMADVDDNQYEFDQRASEAMLRAVREHLPAGIRPALIDTRRG